MNENIYYQIYKWENLVLAWQKARKHKTQKHYIIDFEQNLIENLQQLQFELMTFTYHPRKLKTFILRDPKTRKISKADFRDRIVHHALINIIQPIFERVFIYDSCANRKGKGNLFALKRFDKFKKCVSKNNTKKCFVLKADIKHYFAEVDHKILITFLERKINDVGVIELSKKILNNSGDNGVGMPLGNLTSQFFANVYLNELDYFIKQRLGVKHYIRYVDDFVILHEDRNQIELWKSKIEHYLKYKLRLELHPQKSNIISLFRGIDFVGFRNFYHFKLLRKRNLKKIVLKLNQYENNEISYEKLLESFYGWNAYAKWANSYKIRRKALIEINKIKRNHIQTVKETIINPHFLSFK